MKKTITIQLRPEDAEPILRKAATEAAQYGSLLDYATRKTGNVRHRGGGETIDEARKRWRERYAKAKRMVEAFGTEVEQPSESETLTVDYRYVGGTRKVLANIPGIGPVGCISGSKPDYAHPYPSMRGEIFEEACRQAADRVVRRWRMVLDQSAAA